MAALIWTDPEWLAAAYAWIDVELGRLGRPRTGPVEQPHDRLWATALRAPTADGPVWLKASIPGLRHEAGVVRVLARRRPELLPGLLAVKRGGGWLLLEDAGERLRELLGGRDEDDVLRHWEAILPLYADLQQAVTGDVGELLAVGTPDRRLAALPALYAELLDDDLVRRALAADELRRLRALGPSVGELCDELAAHGVAETIQHDDLHDGQVFVRDGRYLLLDWGDACVGHPFCTLTVTLNSIAYRLDIEPRARQLDRVRDAYLEAWPGPPADRRRAFEIADVLGAFGRALAWHGVVAALDGPDADEIADAVPGWLRVFLEAAA